MTGPTTESRRAGAPDAQTVPDVPVLRAIGSRRSIRYFDSDREVEPHLVGSRHG